MSRNFETFFSQLIETNMTLDIIADFAKARKNVGKISIKLHQLNYLIGKEDLRQAVYDLFNENSAVFDILSILTAVRDNKKVLTSDVKRFCWTVILPLPKRSWPILQKQD